MLRLSSDCSLVFGGYVQVWEYFHTLTSLRQPYCLDLLIMHIAQMCSHVCPLQDCIALILNGVFSTRFLARGVLESKMKDFCLKVFCDIREYAQQGWNL